LENIEREDEEKEDQEDENEEEGKLDEPSPLSLDVRLAGEESEDVRVVIIIVFTRQIPRSKLVSCPRAEVRAGTDPHPVETLVG
jgi:hypothetical protein